MINGPEHISNYINVIDVTNSKKTSTTSHRPGLSESEVESIAEKLTLKFNSVKWRPFYCKVARELPQGKIWELAEIAEAKAKQSPGGYFTTLACKEMGYTPKVNSR